VDFIHDTDERDRPLKWLSVVDEFTRECAALVVDRSMTSRGVAEALIGLFTTRGVPEHIRSDNGPEFIARTIRRLADLTGVETLSIAPGSPWENGYAESFHSHLRDELLNAAVFADVREAKALAASWRHEYNHRRPHSWLGYTPPAAFAAACRQAPPLRRPPARSEAPRHPHSPTDTHSTWYRKWGQVSSNGRLQKRKW
jgi:transposase InsO family protein